MSNADDTRINDECMRCGTCCLADMLAFASEDDIARWKVQGRNDILHVRDNEQAVWAGDHYISSKTGLPLMHCPFLIWEGSKHACAIYETRPGVCADYRPASSQICPMCKK